MIKMICFNHCNTYITFTCFIKMLITFSFDSFHKYINYSITTKLLLNNSKIISKLVRKMLMKISS